MPEIVKTRSEADFLGLVPHLLGFRPQNSVVLIGFRGKRTHGALRLDLPTAAVAYKKVATFALATMSKIPGLEAIAVVVYTDEPAGSHSDFATILTGRVSRGGLEVRGAWCLGGDGWVSYQDRLNEVRPLAEIDLSDAALSMREPLTSSIELPIATEADKRRVAAELDRYRALAARDDYDTDLAPLDDPALFVEQALDWGERELLQFGSLLLFAVQAPAARDATMLQWASSLRVGDDLWQNDTDGADLMLGMGPRPSLERMHHAIALVVHLASIAGEAERVAPLCMLGWLHWAIGQGSAAGRFLEMALDLDPAYSMANLLTSMMSAGYLPPWAFGDDLD